MKLIESYEEHDPQSGPNLGAQFVAHGLLPMLVKLDDRRHRRGLPSVAVEDSTRRWLMPLMTDAQAEAIFVTMRRHMASNLDSIIRAQACTGMADRLMCIARDDDRLRGCMRRAGLGEPFVVPAFDIFKDPSGWYTHARHPFLRIYRSLEQLGHIVRTDD